MRSIMAFIIAGLSSMPAMACICKSGLEYLAAGGEAGEQRALQIAKRQVAAADEVLIVRVVSRKESGNARTYSVQVREAVKPASATQATRTVNTGPDSCQAEMVPNEEWLIFVSGGRTSQCDGSVLLDNARKWQGVSAADAASMNEWYYTMGARWLSTVRNAVRAQGGR